MALGATNQTRIGARLGGFLHWWARELASLVPAEPPKRPDHGEIEIVSVGEAAGEDALLWRGRGRRRRAARRLALPPAPTPPDVDPAEPIPTPARGPALLLPDGAVLSRRLTLPAAAGRQIAAILRHEFGVAMPFAAADAYFTHRVVERRSDRIVLDLLCAAKRDADMLRRRLAEIGMAPRALRLDGVEIDLRRWSDGAPPPRLPWTALGWLGVAALATLVIWTPYAQREAQLLELSAIMAAERTEAEAAIALGEEIAALRAERAATAAELVRPRPAVAVLDALTSVLPDSAFVTRLEIDPALVRLRGEAAAAAPLIGAFEQSDGFADAVFVAPLTKTPSGGERFEIEMRRTEQGESGS